MIKTFNQLTQRLERPLLSIVTVTHNDSEGLRETLESIFTQRRGLNRTQVVVVNASPGGPSTQLPNQFLRRRDTVIAEPDEGIYDGMNKGWRSSSGRFVQFLNSGDTFFDNSSLGVITDALTSHPGARWAIGRAMHQFGGAKAPSEMHTIPHVWCRHAMGIDGHCHQSTLFSRELLEVMDGYDETVGFVADFDLILRCGLVSPPVEIDSFVVKYQGGGLSLNRREEIPGLLRAVRAKRLGLSDEALEIEWQLMPEHQRKIIEDQSRGN